MSNLVESRPVLLHRRSNTKLIVDFMYATTVNPKFECTFRRLEHFAVDEFRKGSLCNALQNVCRQTRLKFELHRTYGMSSLISRRQINQYPKVLGFLIDPF